MGDKHEAALPEASLQQLLLKIRPPAPLDACTDQQVDRTTVELWFKEVRGWGCRGLGKPACRDQRPSPRLLIVHSSLQFRTLLSTPGHPPDA